MLRGCAVTDSQPIDTLFERMSGFSETGSFWHEGHFVSYSSLLEMVDFFDKALADASLASHCPVAVQGDINPHTMALVLACVKRRLICIPLGPMPEAQLSRKLEIVRPEIICRAKVKCGGPRLEMVQFEDVCVTGEMELYQQVAGAADGGLVLFSSGTSGDPKAAVHLCTRVFSRFLGKGKSMRTIGFLLFDHWGGLNTIFHTLFHGGMLICLADRDPETVCKAIEETAAELLPVSPSFLNLLIASGCAQRYDLTSIELISYGAEPMTDATLKRTMAIFPDVRLKQTYGLIELGVFPTQSKGQDSTFFKIKDSVVEHRVRNGMLEIKSPFTMLGYLNAPTPFSDDGWYMTGDKVLVEDGFMTVQGRVSDIINVGGEKVFPQEVESVLIDVEGVDDARVFGEVNFLLGKIVCADVQVSPNADVVELESQIKCQAAEVLEPFKIPIKINFKTEALVNDRLKKSRRN